jgi:hypothetical protein
MENDQQRTGNTQRKPKDIDQGKGFILPEIAPGDYKIISEHSSRLQMRRKLTKKMPDREDFGGQFIKKKGRGKSVRF